MAFDNFNVSWIYSIKDKYSRTLNKINTVTDKFNRKTKMSSQSLKDMSSKMANFRTMMATTAGIAALAMPTKAAANFEDKMIDVKRVVDFATKDQFKNFREGIFKTALYLGKMPNDIASIAYEAGKIDRDPMKLQEFIDLASKTATAFDIMDTLAGTSIAKIKDKLSLTTQETGKMLDVVNYLADTTSATGKDTLNIIQRTLGTMKTLKMPKEMAAGWAAFADRMETSPQLAASGLRLMFRQLKKMPGMMRKMKRDGPHEATIAFFEKWSKRSERAQERMRRRRFGPEASRFVEKLMSSMNKLYDTFAKAKSEKAIGSMLRELTKKLRSANTALGKMKAMINIVAISIGDILLPILKDVTPAFIEIGKKIRFWIQQNPGLVKMGLTVLAVATALSAMALVIGVIAAAGSFLFTPFAAGAALIVTGAGALAGMYFESDKVREAVKRLGKAFQPILDKISKINTDLGFTDRMLRGTYNVSEWTIVKGLNLVSEIINAAILDIKILHSLATGGNVKIWKTLSTGKLHREASERMKNIPPVQTLFNPELHGKIIIEADEGLKTKSDIYVSTPWGVGTNMVTE